MVGWFDNAPRPQAAEKTLNLSLVSRNKQQPLEREDENARTSNMGSESEAPTNATPTKPETTEPQVPDHGGLSGRPLFEFECVRNAAYHEDREHHYAVAHRFLMFIVIAVGTVSVGASMAHDSKLATYGTLVAVLAGLIDVVWNVDGLAREHSILRRRCYDLLARMVAGEPLIALQAGYTRIIADEPPAMQAANALAFNAAVDALGRPLGQKYVLAWWQRLIRHWWRFQPNQFPTIDELKLLKSK
jgi:hypothetical protein